MMINLNDLQVEETETYTAILGMGIGLSTVKHEDPMDLSAE